MTNFQIFLLISNLWLATNPNWKGATFGAAFLVLAAMGLIADHLP